jgi:hypothetical protein
MGEDKGEDLREIQNSATIESVREEKRLPRANGSPVLVNSISNLAP